MATRTEPVAPVTVTVAERRGRGQAVVTRLSTTGHKATGHKATGHKTTGHPYLTTSFAFFPIGGAPAMVARAEPARPGLRSVPAEATSGPPPRHDRATRPGTRPASLAPHHPASACLGRAENTGRRDALHPNGHRGDRT
ncbi:hypothetical protein [Streptomyces sp. NPDC048392]|uniref:hypothetical protein n=1 Tax=Streptomyces sp. NPDC048392 TaxID=3365543 RepID=UPI00371E6205